MNQVETNTVQIISSPQDLLEKSIFVARLSSKVKFSYRAETIRQSKRRRFGYTQIHKFLNDNGVKCFYSCFSLKKH
jgi:hypothetical protein